MKKIQTFITLLLLTSTINSSAYAEQNNQPSGADWQSPESIVDAVYATISAGRNEQRDWERFRALFFDGATFAMSMQSPQFSGILDSDVETMINQTESFYKPVGFYELELDKKVVRHHHMASVYSTFEVKYSLQDEQPLMRGINHFQLLHDGDRWWIISNVSTLESDNFTIPENL